MAGQYRFKDDSGNIVAQISASVDGVISFSGSQVNFSEANTINLGDVQLAGTASNALLLDGFDSQAFAFTSSIHPFTASTNSRLNSIETISASNISRINSLETTSASVNTLNTTQNSRLDSLEIKTGSLATTGSNTFIGTQTVTGSLFVSANLIVQGTSSLQNITASAVSIGTNIVNLNTANPAIRYAGLVIGDSGSIGSSGSFFYDSVQDEMIFVHRGANSTVTSSVVLMGPQTYDTIGSESYLTSNRITKGTGNEHLVDSNITDIGNSIGIGITNPTYPLTRNGMTFKASGTDGAEFVMLSSTDTGFTGGVITRSGMDFGFINRTSGSIIFATNATERMFINSAGNVGIATTSPTAILNVWGDGSTDIIKATRSSVTRFVVKNGTNTVGINTDTVNSALTVNGTVDMVGNVGINTTSAYSPLTLRGGTISWGETMTIYPAPSGYTTIALRLEGTDTTTGTWAIGKQSTIENGGVQYLQIAKNGLTGGALHRADAVQTWDPANGNAYFGFNVGIGNTNPFNFGSGHRTLDVRGNSTSSIGALFVGNSNRTSVLGFYINPAAGGTVGTSSNHFLQLVTNDVERVRIATSGNVGIANDNPLSRLHIGPEASVGGNTPVIVMSSPAGTKPSMLITEYTARSGAFGYDNSNFLTLATEASVTAGIKFKVGSSFGGGLLNNGIDGIIINTSGQVLRPSQPAFLAFSENSGFTVTANGWYNISNALTQESYDIGSNYNASNGRFTAPVAGRYFIYAGGWAQIGSASNGERYAFCARVNDGALTFIGGGNYCIGDTPLSGYTLVCNLAASDYVDLWVFSAVTGTWGSGSHRTYWGGYLL